MSKEELNNDFDVEVRAHDAFKEATAEKVRKHQGLNDTEIGHLCPVALKTTMSKKEIATLIADIKSKDKGTSTEGKPKPIFSPILNARLQRNQRYGRGEE